MDKDFNPDDGAAGNKEIVNAMDKVSILMTAEKSQLFAQEENTQQKPPLRSTAQEIRLSSPSREVIFHLLIMHPLYLYLFSLIQSKTRNEQPWKSQS